MNKRNKQSFSGNSRNQNSYASNQKTSHAKSEELLKLAIFALVLLIAAAFTVFLIFSNGCGESSPNKENNLQVDNDNITPAKQFLAKDTDSTKAISEIDSEYAILVKVSDLSVLASKGADTPIYPASMTKIMTVAVACDLVDDLEATYTVKNEVLQTISVQGASRADLKDGFVVSVKDLLYGISYRSGADSVVCLLDYLGISTEEFVKKMNDKASEIGLTSTHFGGPIGFDIEENTTTCRDMAGILAYAMEDPLCRELFSGTTYRLEEHGLIYYHLTLVNTIEGMGTRPNKLVSGYTMVAAKSGFEDKAGHCLASYTEDAQGNGYIVVTAKATTDTSTHGKIKAINDYIKIIENYTP